MVLEMTKAFERYMRKILKKHLNREATRLGKKQGSFQFSVEATSRDAKATALSSKRALLS